MADIEKTSDDPNKKQTSAPETAVESSTGGTLAKSHGDNFTSFSHKTISVSEFSIEDKAEGVSITAQGVKPSDSAMPESAPPSVDYISAKANEIMEAAGTFKVPTADQISIGGKWYNKSDVIAQGNTPYKVDDRGGHSQPRQMTEVEKAAEAKRLGAQEMAHLKALNEQIQKKGDPVQYLGNVSESFKNRMQDWWKTVPDSTKELMRSKGVHIVVAEYTTDVYPNANNTLARGHHGDSIATTGGAFAPEIHSVLMVDKPVPPANMHDSSGGHQLGLTQKAIFAKAWHELGHALDYDALNHLARSPGFDKAFKAGLARLNSEKPEELYFDKKNFDYFLSREAHPARGHEDDKPHEEMLAELFARAHFPAGFSDTDLKMLKVFKEVVNLMRSEHLMAPESTPGEKP